VSDAIGAALIAAVSSVVGSVLTFIVGIRQIRRSVSTSTRSGVFVVCGQNSRRGGTYDHWGLPGGLPGGECVRSTSARAAHVHHVQPEVIQKVHGVSGDH